MWRGIRVRIATLATLVVIAVLILTAVALVTVQRRLLTDNLDEALTSFADELGVMVVAGDLVDPIGPRLDDDAIAQVVDGDGRVVAASATYSGRPALDPPTGTGYRLQTEQVVEGEPRYRVVSVRVDGFVVHTAAPLDDIDESIAALRLGLSIAIPTVAVVLGLLIWWLVGRTLRPVESIRRAVADISGQNLHVRVDEPGSGDEISRLAHTMNAMLDRVEQASGRQQRFVADASHELRSPLTRIRSELEVDLAHPETADLAATHRSVLDETSQLQRLVEDLLILARQDSGGSGGRPHVVVDLEDIVMDEARRLRTTPTTLVGDRPRVDTTGVSAVQVEGDPDQLARVVRNLLDNAARHAHSMITVTLVEQSNRAVLGIADDGGGVAAEHRELVFERFTRVDDARTRRDGGTGLGLAIARALTERHAGTISIDADHAPGARFLVEIPVASP